jgi:hypothetical protein
MPRMTSAVFGIFCACVLAAAGGCRTPPDVHPFADATQSLTLAVNGTEADVRREIAKVDPARAGDFKKEWGHRLKAMEAMADYADSLVAVVDAGNQGGAAAEKVVGSVNTLLTTVSAAYPAGGVVAESLSKAVVAGYARYAKDRAAGTVAAALADADPAVQEVARILADDFDTMTSILTTLRSDEVTDFVTKAKASDPSFAAVESARSELRTVAGQAATNPSVLPQFAAVQDRIGKDVSRPDYIAYLARLKSIDDRYDRYDAVVRQAADLTRAWGRSHTSLIQASETSRTPGFQVLIEVSREMVQIYRESRKRP